MTPRHLMLNRNPSRDERVAKVEYWSLRLIKNYELPQRSISLSPERTHVALPPYWDMRINGPPASYPSNDGIFGYCPSILGAYRRYIHSDRLVYVDTIFMCTNTLMWTGTGAVLFLLNFYARSVPAQICITHVNWDPLDLSTELPEWVSL
jgi:hypothetical protein